MTYNVLMGTLNPTHSLTRIGGMRSAVSHSIGLCCDVMKAVLEKTLEDVKDAEEHERDSYALMRLSQRRQVVEQKLIRVRQQLAESSKVSERNCLACYLVPV